MLNTLNVVCMLVPNSEVSVVLLLTPSDTLSKTTVRGSFDEETLTEITLG